MLKPLIGGLLIALSAAAQADPRDFTLVNGTPWTIRRVYVAPSYMSSWGSDVLAGDQVLYAGNSTYISFPSPSPGTCVYDIRVVFHGDTSVRPDWSNVNLCETERARIWFNKDTGKYMLSH